MRHVYRVREMEKPGRGGQKDAREHIQYQMDCHWYYLEKSRFIISEHTVENRGTTGTIKYKTLYCIDFQIKQGGRGNENYTHYIIHISMGLCINWFHNFYFN